MKKKYFYFLLFIVGIIADRLTKAWAIRNLTDASMSLFTGLNFSLTWNRGVTSSLLTPTTAVGFWILFAAITMIFIVVMAYTWLQYYNNSSIVCEVIILAGAAGNIIDRLWYGAVVDFIDCAFGAWHWPTFNVADIFITVGVLCVILQTFSDSDKPRLSSM